MARTPQQVGLGLAQTPAAPTAPGPGAETLSSGAGRGLSHQDCRQPSGGEESVRGSWLRGGAGEMGSQQPLCARQGTGILCLLWARPQFPAGQPGQFQDDDVAPAKAGVGMAVCKPRGSGQGGTCVVPEAHLVPTSQSPMVQRPGQWLFQPGASSQMGAHGAAGDRRIPRGAWANVPTRDPNSQAVGSASRPLPAPTSTHALTLPCLVPDPGFPETQIPGAGT